MFSISQMLSVREQTKLSTRTFETLLDLNDRPHLLLAIEIRGAIFPHMNAEPFVQIVDERRRGARSWIADVADDGSAITGYFPLDADLSGSIVEFGYGSSAFGRIANYRASGEKLDRDRLSARTVVVTIELIRKISKLKSDEDPLAVLTE
ncbi:hypothetical protein H9L13_00245 [Sphingomonas lutea]|uniref:Uncharacterized protein n=1 Tax=Sphingomonas lutea TaxID=1045317 RepID=A0A7G9SHX1_9SPHN|nr:hypothetical protein [Sphingomonas lutea]QNN67446.1 hypothetical protein H9L13_00245 [Sphingomonas lutea]